MARSTSLPLTMSWTYPGASCSKCSCSCCSTTDGACAALAGPAIGHGALDSVAFCCCCCCNKPDSHGADLIRVPGCAFVSTHKPTLDPQTVQPILQQCGVCAYPLHVHDSADLIPCRHELRSYVDSYDSLVFCSLGRIPLRPSESAQTGSGPIVVRH